MMLSLDTAYRSFGGEVEASSTPTICAFSDSRRHQLSAIAHRRAGIFSTTSVSQCCARRDVRQQGCVAEANPSPTRQTGGEGGILCQGPMDLENRCKISVSRQPRWVVCTGSMYRNRASAQADSSGW